MTGFQLEPGSLFAGDFRIVRPLSQGGMGAVYVAEQLSTRAERALKLMHPELVRNAGLRARFEQEARVAAQIPSDHVVQVIAAGVDAGTGMPWLAMELLDGADLLESTATGRAGPTVLREIMAQLCHALGAAHDRGIVHRDLKPENIFLATPRRAGTPFTVKVLDFGIAKVSIEARSGSATASLGTPLWMAPEQAGASSGVIAPATDVWALGLIAFWLLTGRHYWRSARQDGVTLEGLMREVLLDPLEPASARARELESKVSLPRGFDEWFARTVVREPSARFVDATAAFRALEEILMRAPSPPGPVRESPKTVPKTVDDMPPLRQATTPGAPPMLGASASPAAWISPEPQPRMSPLPVSPSPVLQPPGAGSNAFPAQTPVGTGQPVVAPAWDSRGLPMADAVERRRSGCWVWAALLLASGFGLAIAGAATRDEWEPALASYWGGAPEAPPPLPRVPAVECPAGSRREGERCIKLIDATCPSGMRFTSRGCVAIVAAVDAGSAVADAAGANPPGTQMSYLTVMCSPQCSVVRVDGKSLGPSPVSTNIPAGVHVVRGERAGYQSQVRSLKLQVGASTRVTLRLSPAAGPAPTTTKPAGSVKPAPTATSNNCNCAQKVLSSPCSAYCALQNAKKK